MRLRPVLSALILFLIVLFEVALAQESFPFIAEVNSDNINLRSDSTASAYAIGVLKKGERLEVVQESYGWYKVRLPKTIPAYVKGTLASCINYNQSQPEVDSQSCLAVKVLKDRVNIRAQASESSVILGVADQNEVITVTGQDGFWYKIEPITNSFGWVNSKFLDKVETGPGAKVVYNTALNKDPSQGQENVVLTGIIKPYGMVFGRPATHKLVTEGNNIFLLKGSRASLNALNNQKVRVIGKKLSNIKSKYPIVEVKIIEVIN
jgi:uncharacterized protein YgiM (DUF1202 family)